MDSPRQATGHAIHPIDIVSRGLLTTDVNLDILFL